MPEDMPDRMPDRMPEDMSEYMPEDVPDRMPDRMPNRMPEDMSDRMPQDLPVRKCINVMVGITRSKVILIIHLSSMGYDGSSIYTPDLQDPQDLVKPTSDIFFFSHRKICMSY